MAIAYFNSAATPADNGTQAGPTVAVTPPASMVTGDLVLLVAGYKASGVTFAMSVTGGQTWTALTQFGGATSGVTGRLFWCRYNGTWAANPSVTITAGTLAMSVQMHVFRPTTGTNTWSVFSPIEVKDAAANSNMTIDFLEMTAGDLGFGAFISNDDNTISNATPSTFVTAGTAQYRNLQGNDISMGAQYRIETGTTTDKFPAFSQATLGADTYGMCQLVFRETSSGTSITADPGTYNLTGTAATLTAQRKITADAGAYGLTGVDASLSKGFRMVADPGTFNLSGTDAGLTAQRKIVADTGAYLLSGTDATLTKAGLTHYTLVADSGTLAMTGQSANLTKGFKLSADAGGYVVTGTDANLTAQRKLIADAGGYVLSGTSAGLFANRLLSASPGIYTYTGQDATLTKSTVNNYSISADSGSYVLNGVAANLLHHKYLSGLPGAYVITGQDAELTYQPAGAYELNADPGSYSLNGTAANLTVQRLLTAVAGNYILSGTDVNLLRTYRLEAEPGIYILTGTGATLGAAEYFINAKSIIYGSIAGGSSVATGITTGSKINGSITAKSIIYE